jgi:hypothetical protein
MVPATGPERILYGVGPGRRTALFPAPLSLLPSAILARSNGRHAPRNRHLIAGMAALVVAGIAVDVFAAPRTSEAGILGGEAEGKR